jgi:hypothetical protein
MEIFWKVNMVDPPFLSDPGLQPSNPHAVGWRNCLFVNYIKNQMVRDVNEMRGRLLGIKTYRKLYADSLG